MVGKLEKLLFLILQNPVFLAAFICAVLFYSNILHIADREEFKCLLNYDSITELNGVLSSNPVKTASGAYYSARSLVSEVQTSSGSKGSAKGSVCVYVPASFIEALYPGKIYTKVKNESILFEQGVSLKLKVRFLPDNRNSKPTFIVESATSEGFENSLWGKFRALRARSRIQFKRLMYGWKGAGALLLALLSGSREYTEDGLADAFRKAGLSHILALSGMHLSLFGGIAFFLGNKIARRNLADLLQLLAVLFFVWFAGVSPSLFRSLLSSLIMFVNSSLRLKRFKGLTVLSASFLIHIMIYPSDMISVTFMLSYGALFGIMTLGQLIKMLLTRRIFPKLSDGLSQSAGAQLFTAPISIRYFGAVMPIGIISTLFMSPLILLFLYTGLFAIIICLLLPFLEPFFNVIMNIIYKAIQFTVNFFQMFPSITIRN